MDILSDRFFYFLFFLSRIYTSVELERKKVKTSIWH